MTPGDAGWHTGRLLVATPALAEGVFARSVVLVLDHDEDGALGVVLNHPTPLPVAEVLPPWAGHAVRPDVVFQGGPVAVDSALGLAVTAAEGEPLGFRRLYARTGLVDLDAPPQVLAPELSSLRIFAGYAGWAAGQLEDEVRDGSWFVLDAAPGDAFSEDPADLWRAVLRRQPSQLAFVASFPDDPTLN